MEVSKSLDSVEGAVLLCDAAQGVQAQTLSVFDKAVGIGRLRRGAGGQRSGAEEGAEEGDFGGMRILPALTKMDMPSARPVSGRPVRRRAVVGTLTAGAQAFRP